MAIIKPYLLFLGDASDQLAASKGRKLFDARNTSIAYDVANGKKRTGKRLLQWVSIVSKGNCCESNSTCCYAV